MPHVPSIWSTWFPEQTSGLHSMKVPNFWRPFPLEKSWHFKHLPFVASLDLRSQMSGPQTLLPFCPLVYDSHGLQKPYSVIYSLSFGVQEIQVAPHELTADGLVYSKQSWHIPLEVKICLELHVFALHYSFPTRALVQVGQSLHTPRLSKNCLSLH